MVCSRGDFQRVPQPVQVFRQTEDLAAEGAERFRGRRAQRKTGIEQRDRPLRGG